MPRKSDALRRDPAIVAAGAVLGTALYGRSADSLVTLFGYGIQPEAQSLYQVTAGEDLTAADTVGVLVSEPAARLLGATVGDTVTLVGRLDPQIVTAAVGRRLLVRGVVRWLYDYRGQPSVGTALPVMQRLAGQSAADGASLILVKAQTTPRCLRLRAAEERFLQIEVNSVTDWSGTSASVWSTSGSLHILAA